MNPMFHLDKKRYPKQRLSFLREPGLRFTWLLRKCQSSRNPLWFLLLSMMRFKYGLEIGPRVSIGPGLYLGHSYNITINPLAVIGRNVNIHRGVLIGQENRGSRKGSPTIGDAVWIGVNAAIVGNITIGSDVLIAPNSYVNCDVPDHSIVFGNPCTIVSREHATEHYINHVV